MAQTKRKRRTKHRGTAAGTIEARGRTGRKPTAQETRAAKGAAQGGGRAARPNKPPTWGSALAKAGFGAAMLFLLMQLGVLGGDSSAGQAAAVSVFAVAAYTPIMYLTDRFIYQRRLRKEGGS